MFEAPIDMRSCDGVLDQSWPPLNCDQSIAHAIRPDGMAAQMVGGRQIRSLVVEKFLVSMESHPEVGVVPKHLEPFLKVLV